MECMLESKLDDKPKLQIMDELDKFCKEFNLYLELEKPFKEFEELLLKVTYKDKTLVDKETVKNILKIEEDASKLLGRVSKDF